MDDIKFEVDQAPRMNLSTAKESSFAKWIMKLGITNSITTANYILVAIAVLFLGITIFMYARIFSGNEQAPVSVEEQQMTEGASPAF